MNKVLFDLDDLWEGHHPEIWHGEPRFDLLLKLKEEVPNLKVTLFASPGLCSTGYLEYVNSFDWIEIGLHGWYHTAKECDHWGTSIAKTCLVLAESMEVFAPIFRPPQWASSDGLEAALKKFNWIFAGHPTQQRTRDFHNKGGKVFFSDAKQIIPGVPQTYLSVHGHLTSGINNSIEVMFDTWVEQFKNKEFEFITNAVNKIYEKTKTIPE